MAIGKENITELALTNVQKEWEENRAFHEKRRHEIDNGIRSSQVSAMIAYLVDIGVITDDNVNNTNLI